jgi:hypothetical protein
MGDIIAVISAMMRNIKQKDHPCWPDKKQDPVSKINRGKGPVVCLKCIASGKALNSNPSTTQKILKNICIYVYIYILKNIYT